MPSLGFHCESNYNTKRNAEMQVEGTQKADFAAQAIVLADVSTLNHP